MGSVVQVLSRFIRREMPEFMYYKGRMQVLARTTLMCLLFAYLTGCAQLGVLPDPDSARSQCDELFNALDNAVVEQGVQDAQDRRLSVAPYLRVNRLLSSFRDEVRGKTLQQWLDAMQDLGIQGWAIEYANLSAAVQQSLWEQAQAVTARVTTFTQVLNECADQDRQQNFSTEAEQQALRKAAVVEDNYSMIKRILGVYPLSALVFRKGISDWHEETRRRFALSLTQMPVSGHLQRYTTGQTKRLLKSEVQDILRTSAMNPLQIPVPTEAQLASLMSTYAPIYEIDTVSDDDRIGVPMLSEGAQIEVDTQQPMVYQYVSHTRFQQQVLLQLNYLIWFPARTATSGLDLLAGKLDGITWRVTLLPNGEPLVFDTMHNCGCYHLFFAGPDVTVLPEETGLTEPAFFPTHRHFSHAELPLVLRISSGSHYIEAVYPQAGDPGPDHLYSLRSADGLRNLPWAGVQHRSLYDQQGLVAGSERLERFLFWPMGIPSAGAMRQAGHHATAFVGRRHFDDAYLFESLLERNQ